MVIKKKILFGVLIFLALPIISAFNEQLVDPCFGDTQISSTCFEGDPNIFYFGKVGDGNIVITLILPEDGTMDDDGIVRFIFNPTGDNTLSTCSLIYQGGTYTTITPTKDVNNIIEVVGIESNHPLYNDNLQWGINCTDNLDNVGSSEIRNLDTRTDGGRGGGISVPVDKNPKFINIIYNEIWTRGENIIVIEAFDQDRELFLPKNITFDIIEEKINLKKKEIINETTIAKFTVDEQIKDGTYLIELNVIDERTIEEPIFIKIEKEIIELDDTKDNEKILRYIKYGLIGIAIISIFMIILILVILDRRKRKR